MADPGKDMKYAFEDGEWSMFERITSVYFGKQYYSVDSRGLVYSRLSHECVGDKEAAYNEFLDYISW